MHIAMLGRQPALGMAELERVYGDVRWFAHDSALINSETFDIQHLGGTVKAGLVVRELSGHDWRKTSMELVRMYQTKWAKTPGKITVGISAYGFTITAKDVQRTAHILKSKLRDKGVSLRVVPNEQAELSSASSHHNKLGLSPNKVEILVIRGHNGKVIIAESTGAQNITALAKRDRSRPARDAFVGMLPPKLAQIMVNLAVGKWDGSKPPVVLDPFCGTGVILQEAVLLGYSAYGTDMADKMIDYTKRNLEWLQDFMHHKFESTVHQGDATETQWQQPVDVIAAETYLGQPFSAPPSEEKLAQVKQTCETIIGKFLTNVGKQIKPGTPLCIAVPAWQGADGKFTHLPLVRKVEELGYKQIKFQNVSSRDLLYYRPEQVVGRELLILEKQ